MENLIIQTNSIPVSKNDIIILTFGEEYDIDGINEFMKALKKDYPDYHFLANMEGMINNITVLQELPLIYNSTDRSSYDNIY